MAKSKKKDADVTLLAEARERFQQCYDFEDDDRTQSEEDQEFENGKQWTDNDQVERSGRPCLTINKVAATTKQIIGDSRQNRPAIKVRPAGDGAKKAVANVLTGIVRNIENISDAESVYDFGISSSTRGGWGAWRVVTEFVDDNSFDQDIIIKRIVNPLSVYIDPNSTDMDNRDARFGFVIEEIPVDEFKKEYPKADKSSWEESTQKEWVIDKNIRIAEYFYKTYVDKEILLLEGGKVVNRADVEILGDDDKYVIVDGEPLGVVRERTAKEEKVKWCKFSGESVLEKGDWAGKYIPLIVCLGEEVWVKGKRERRSAIRFAKDSQRLYNWARSNSVETMALSPKQPFLLTADEIEGHEQQWAKANHTPQPYLLYNHKNGIQGRPQRQQGSFPDSGAIQEAMLAADDIKATTQLYDAGMGARSNETSGKAIRERRMESDTASFEFHDNQAKAIRQTGRIIVDLIPHIYDTERTLRIIGEDGKEDIVTVNQAIQSPGQNENPVMYDLKVGRYDVVVDTGPGYATKRQEASDGMIRTLEIFPQGAPVLVPLIAKNSDWPDADNVSEKLEEMMGGPKEGEDQPPPDPEQAMKAQKGQLDIEGKTLDNTKKKMDISEGQAEQQQMMAQVAQQAVLMTLNKLGLV